MAYHSFIPFLGEYCENFKRSHPHHPYHVGPSILEIGIDLGQTMIPLITDLLLRNIEFRYDAADIVLHESVIGMLGMLKRDQAKHRIRLYDGNSLVVIPQLIHDLRKQDNNIADVKPSDSTSAPYDIILIDGDHNYGTVYNELRLLVNLSTTLTLLVIDDYNTRYATNDMFYHSRPGYEKYDATPPNAFKLHETQKGVKTAVDDFLCSFPDWRILNWPWPENHDVDISDAVILYHAQHPMADRFADPQHYCHLYKTVGARTDHTTIELYKVSNLNNSLVYKNRPTDL